MRRISWRFVTTGMGGGWRWGTSPHSYLYPFPHAPLKWTSSFALGTRMLQPCAPLASVASAALHRHNPRQRRQNQGADGRVPRQRQAAARLRLFQTAEHDHSANRDGLQRGTHRQVSARHRKDESRFFGGDGRGWVGLGVCSLPVSTDPEAPSPEVLWQSCQVAPGSPAFDKATADPGRLRCSEARHMPMHMHTYIHNRVHPWP